MFNIVRKSLFCRKYDQMKIILQYTNLSTNHIGRFPLSKVINFKSKHMTKTEWDGKLVDLMRISEKTTIYNVLKLCFILKNKSLAESFLEYLKDSDGSLCAEAQVHYLKFLTIHKSDLETYNKLHTELTRTYDKDEHIMEAAAKQATNFPLINTPMNPFENDVKNDGILMALEKYRTHKTGNIIYSFDDLFTCIENEIDITKGRQALKILLHLWCQQKIPIKLKESIRLLHYLNSNNITHTIISIYNEKPCRNCGTALPIQKVTEEDVEILKNALEEDVVKGMCIYFKTTPTEWNNFKAFLKERGKFDIIIDGLNFSYDLEKDGKDAQSLRNDLKLYGSRHLFIGRDYAHQEIKRTATALGKRFHYFYPDRDSQDDLFVVYAALYNGLGTKYVTGDFLRSHKRFFDNKHRQLFFNWQKHHQILTENYRLQPCSVYDNVPHFNGVDTFHIPRDKLEQLFPANKWLCLSL